MTLLAPLFGNDPDVPAFRIGAAEISYGQFCQDIDTMAWWLRDNKVGIGTGLGIGSMGGHHYWTWVAHLAAIRIGARHATITNAGSLRAAMATGGRGLEFFLVAGDQPPALPRGLRPLRATPTGLEPLADQLGVAARPWEDAEAERSAARLAATLGKTGRWRSCLWTSEILGERIKQAEGRDFSPAGILCPAVGLMTGPGFLYPIAAWRAGGTVLSWAERDVVPSPVPQAVQLCSLLVATPANLRSLIAGLPPSWQGREQRAVLVVGGRLSAALRDQALQKACARLEIRYDLIETGKVAGGDAALIDRHSGAVGAIAEDAAAEIVDADDRAVPPGEEGILRIRTAAMCAGYENAREFGRSAAFRDGWFYPGDRGALFEDGLLALTGRDTETVNVAGISISLTSLENQLADVPAVADLCAVPVSLKQGDVIAIVAVLGGHANLTPLRHAARNLLPRRCPFRVVAVPRIPRNKAGKVERSLLSKQLAAQL